MAVEAALVEAAAVGMTEAAVEIVEEAACSPPGALEAAEMEVVAVVGAGMAGAQVAQAAARRARRERRA